MGSTFRFFFAAVLLCVLVSGVQSEALLRFLPEAPSLPTSPPTTTTSPPTTNPPSTTTAQTTTTNPSTTPAATTTFPTAPAPSLFALRSCDTGVLTFSVVGNGLGWIRVLEAKTGNPVNNTLDGTQAARVPPGASSGLQLVLYEVPWQSFFTPYTAVLVSNPTYGSVVVGSFNFTCRDGQLTNPPPTTTSPIVLKTTPPPPPPDQVFGPLNSSCTSEGGGVLIRVTAQLVIKDIVLSPTRVVVKAANGTVVWSSQIYSFDPMVLVIRVPRDFNLNATYLVLIYASNDTSNNRILLHDYQAVQFCPPPTPPPITFGPKTPAAPKSSLKYGIYQLDCNGAGIITFSLYGKAQYLGLVRFPFSEPWTWELNLLDLKILSPLPNTEGNYIARFQVPAGAGTYVATLVNDLGGNQIQILAQSVALCGGLPAPTLPATTRPAPRPSRFVLVNCIDGVASFEVTGQSAAIFGVRDQSPTPGYVVNKKTEKASLTLLDIPGTRYFTFTLPSLFISKPLTALVLANPSVYGQGVITGELNFTCTSGPTP